MTTEPTCTCKYCHNTYPYTPEYFHRDGSRLRHTCKDCRRKQLKGYRQTEHHKEYRRKAAKEYYYRHRDEILKKRKQWRLRNLEKVRHERAAYWRSLSLEKKREKQARRLKREKLAAFKRIMGR